MIEYISQEASAIPFRDRRNEERKTPPEDYRGIVSRKKTFEICGDDEDIRPGDIIVFREWDGEKYTGGRTRREVVSVMRGGAGNGIMPGFRIASLQTPGWDRFSPSACLDGEEEEPYDGA